MQDINNTKYYEIQAPRQVSATKSSMMVSSISDIKAT